MEEKLALIALLAPALLVYPFPALRKGADHVAWGCLVVALKVSAGGAAIAGVASLVLFPLVFVAYFMASAVAASIIGLFYLAPLLVALKNQGRLSFPIAFFIGLAPGLFGQLAFDGIEPFAFAAMCQGPIIAGLCVARIREETAEAGMAGATHPENAPPEA